MVAPIVPAAVAAARAAAAKIAKAAKAKIAKAAKAKIAKAATARKGGWFQKIPSEILLSPGGMILVILALIIEIIDLIPVPLIDQLIELPLEIFFIVFLVIIAKTSFKSLIIPFVIERIPLVSDILPTWLIRLFV